MLKFRYFILVLLFSPVAAFAQQPGSVFSGSPPGTGGPMQQQGQQQGQSSKLAGQGTFIAVATTESRATTIRVAGRLEPARRIIHTASVAGFVEAIHVRPGDRVAAGQSLLTISRDAPGESYRPLIVSSRIAGTVSSINLMQGEELRAGTSALTIIDDSSFLLKVSLSDKDAFRVASMSNPALSALTIDGVTLRGTLESVSAEPDYETGLFSAVLRFNPQRGARLGTVLFVELPVETLRGIFVDQSLVIRRFSHNVLWIIADDETLKLVQVTTGPLLGNDIPITAGLSPGTRYITRLSGYEREGLSLEAYREAVRKGY